MKKILITGGSGLVGTRLTELLLASGNYEVMHLSRSGSHIPGVTVYEWDVEAGEMEEEAIQKADCVIHLAGTSIMEKAWIDSQKEKIIESRTLSTALLVEKLTVLDHHVKTYIGASAIGYYGFEKEHSRNLHKEDAPAGNDFLAQVCVEWEKAHAEVPSNIRSTIIRIGIVLSDKGGALVEMAKPVKAWAGAALGDGNQVVSWIHIDDLCRIFIKAIEDNKMTGTYNAVAPNPVTNAELTRIIANSLDKPLFLPNVPEPAMYLLLGQQAESVLRSIKASDDKIVKAGFEFDFVDAQKAVDDFYK
ncbi:TIGR01777 family oxidoreductase [Bernardetia sp. MNP-M8]|uniref:TIGR01777 family oxidoreductase n=1 Tax=Bernardetia sp. MNP-M8 TaxID=3127470 RepID=UPI0030D40B98